jgi:D-alanine-D-alanine ligase
MLEHAITVLILYTPASETPYREHVSERQLAMLEQAVHAAGWSPKVARYSPTTLASIISAGKPRVLLNLAYGYRDPATGFIESQARVASRLEALDLVCVGAPAASQALAQDKLQTAEVLRPFGIRSPRVLRRDDGDLGSLAVAKPRFGACRRDVRLVDPRDPVTWMSSDEPTLIQEYVDGPEWSVGVVEGEAGPMVLAPLRLDFEERDRPTIADYRRFPWVDVVDRDESHGLRALSLEIFARLGLRDYARFDYRVDRRGPVLLDANALPNLEPAASLLPIMASHSGLDYKDLVTLLILSALRRCSEHPQVAPTSS